MFRQRLWDGRSFLAELVRMTGPGMQHNSASLKAGDAQHPLIKMTGHAIRPENQKAVNAQMPRGNRRQDRTGPAFLSSPTNWSAGSSFRSVLGALCVFVVNRYLVTEVVA